MAQFFKLNYFRSRKNNGSFRIKIDDYTIIESGHLKWDDDEIIAEAVKSKQIPTEDAEFIVDVECIEEEEYKSSRK